MAPRASGHGCAPGQDELQRLKQDLERRVQERTAAPA